jgi:hypothetical protein
MFEIGSLKRLRPLKNAPFCPISLSGSNFNPQNTLCIRACPVGPEDRTGWLKFSSSLNLNKIEHFSKVSGFEIAFASILTFYETIKVAIE